MGMKVSRTEGTRGVVHVLAPNQLEWSEDSGDPAQNLFDDPEITDESDTGSHRNNRTRAKEG